MKKRFLLISAVLFSTIGLSQVGIGTDEPHESAILHLESTNKALLLPKTTIENIVAENGMIAYDNKDRCVKFYQNNAWTPCIGSSLKALPKEETLDNQNVDLN